MSQPKSIFQIGTSQNNRAGGYAISTIDTRPWLNTPVTTGSTKQRKGKGEPSIVNQIFADALIHTDDPYWVNIFKQASFGKLPRKFTFKGGYLIFKRNQRLLTTLVPSDPYEAYNTIINFFRHHGGMSSERDQEILRYEQQMIQMNNQENETWTTLKKRMKEIMICNYIIDMRDELHLSPKETQQLTEVLNNGVILKFIGKNDIDIVDRHIVRIRGLLWNPDTRLFSIDANFIRKAPKSKSKPAEISYEPPTKPTIEPKDTIVSFHKNWLKFLETLEKEYIKNVAHTAPSPSSNKTGTVKIVIKNVSSNNANTNKSADTSISTGTTSSNKTDMVSSANPSSMDTSE
jgi:hypothetical protein